MSTTKTCVRCGAPARWVGDACPGCRETLAAEAGPCSCGGCALHLREACAKPAAYYLENFVRAPGAFAFYCAGCASRLLDTSMFSGPYLGPPS